jgi:hypothetical protein
MQRDSLGIEIYSKHVAIQKLEYIHTNAVKGLWQLAKNDIRYYYSSAKFYETGVDDFGFLTWLIRVPRTKAGYLLPILVLEFKSLV